MSPASVRITRIVDDVRTHLLARARLAVGLLLGAAVASALVVAWLLAGRGWQQGTPVPLIIDLALIGVGILAWLAQRHVGRRWLRERNLAGSMEETAGLAPGILQGSLELSRSLPAGVSSSLAVSAAERALGDLKGPHPTLAGRMASEAGRWVRRGVVGLTVMVPLVIVLTAVAPTRSFAAWSGLARPLWLLAGPNLPPLEVTPGSAEILRGTDVALDVSAPGRVEVTVHWQAAGDVKREQRLDVVADRTSFLLRTVAARTEYWVDAPDGASSPRYRLDPVDPLLVSEVTVELTFPPHTGRFPEEYRGDVPPLVVPVGSRLRITGQASRPLGSAGLESAQGGEATELRVDGRSFEGDWVPRTSGTYPWRFTDVEGGEAEVAPLPLELTLVPDSAPAVAVLLPGRDTILPVSLRQPLVLEAADDYGLDRLELVVYRVTVFGDRMEPVEQPMHLGGTRGALVRPIMDLSRWELLPGDTVRYFVRAVDNAPTPNVSRTPEYVLRPPTASELRREAQERLDEVAQGVEELEERAEAEAEETRDLERQRSGQEDPERPSLTTPRGQERRDRMDFEEQEDIRGALEDQEELLNAVDSLEAELAKMGQDLEAAGLGDPDLQKELSELQRLLDELAPESLKERLRELGEQVEDMDRREADDALQELSEDQEALRDRLEEALERFRRAAMEQDFRATTAEAEELALQEQALADAMKEGDDPELRADQQEALAARAEALEDRLERLQQRLEDTGEEAARDAVEQAAERGEQAQRSMSDAARQSRQGQSQSASQSAQEAAEGMEQMAQELQDAQAEMAERLMKALQEALQQTATDALSMARRQSELRDEMRGAGQETIADLRGDEAALLQGVRNMADNLSVMNQVTQGGDDREVVSQMGQAMEAVQETLNALQDQRGRTPSPYSSAEGAIQALNQVALSAMAAAQQAGQGQSGQELMEQLEQLAQQQGSLNNQTGQLTPMQLGEQAMSSQLQDMAQGQQEIAEELGDLAEQPGSEGQSLGDLEALALEALELAERLAGNRLDAETLQRQQRLFHRLLDAGRSLEKEELSEERESTRPGQFDREAVDALSPEDLGAFRFQLPPAESLLRLSPAQRQMVLQYFERLNRARRGAGAGGRGGG